MTIGHSDSSERLLRSILEMPSQHLDGLSVRREEAIVLRSEALGEELVSRGRFLDRGVVKRWHHRGADQHGRSSAERIAPAMRIVFSLTRWSIGSSLTLSGVRSGASRAVTVAPLMPDRPPRCVFLPRGRSRRRARRTPFVAVETAPSVCTYPPGYGSASIAVKQ